MAKTIKISDEVLAILKRSKITDTSLRLPDEQLDRATYQAVDKIIKAAGGKWSKTHKAHLFEVDPRAALGLALETGAVENKQQTYQEFFTPDSIVRQMCELAEIRPGDRVLEPSAGHGAIADYAEALGAKVLCCELQEASANKLRSSGKFTVWCGDFLTLSSDIFCQFDAVLMNPPFSGGQDRDHVRHAYEFLCNGGRLVAVMSAGTVTGSTKDHKAFREWVDRLGGTFTDVEPGAFKESGTNVATVLLEITAKDSL